MHLSKYSCSLIAILTSSISYAAIPIETVALSQDSNTAAATKIANNTTTTNTSLNTNWQLIQKNEKLEEEVRKLRGTVEEHDYTIQQLKKDIDNRYADLDQRLQLLQQKLDAEQQQAQERLSQQPIATSQTTTPTQQQAPQKNEASTNKPATTINSTAIPNKTTEKPKTVANTPPINTDTEKKADTENKNDLTEKEDYTLALEAYKQGGAKKAIAPMESFIKKHPKSVYVGNAHFWLAEFNLAINPADYAAAKKNYAIVAKKYPESDKASRALYQLYSIAKEVDHNTALANTCKQMILSKYPKSKEAGYFKATP